MSYPYNTAALGIDTGALASAGVVLQPNPDPSGVANVTQIMNALAAGQRFITLAPTGLWTIKGGQIVNSQATGYYLNMPGTLIKGVGTGDLINWYDTSAYNPRAGVGGGFLGMPSIDLGAMTGNVSGIHAGDILHMQIFVDVRNGATGTTSKNVWLDNRYFQTEWPTGIIRSASGAPDNVVFDNSTGTSLSALATGSFDRMNLVINAENNGVGNGVKFNNGAQAIDFDLTIGGNFQTGASLFSALTLIGSNAGGFSNLASPGRLHIGCELDSTGSTNPRTINFGAGGNAIFNVAVDMNFSGAAWATSNNAGNTLMTGVVNGDATLGTLVSLGSATFQQNITGNGQTIFSSYLQQNEITGTGGFTGLIQAAGAFDGQTIDIVNSTAGTLTYAVAGTSHVADGAALPIPSNTGRRLVWIGPSSLWYRTNG